MTTSDPGSTQVLEKTTAPALAVTDVSVRFGGLRALADVSLTAQRGEIVGLIGPNGAGKTTLLNVVTGLIRPQTGKVAIGGEDLGRASVHQRARMGLARTFQRVTLFSELSVRQHVQLASEVSRPRRAQRLGTSSELDPEAFLRSVGLRVAGASDVAVLPLGNARLVELAMALATRPTVLLLDEPFSGLAANEREHLSRLLGEVRDETAVAIVLVEHDVDMVSRIADRVVVLDFGVVIGEGPPAVVLADPTVRQAYFGTGG